MDLFIMENSIKKVKDKEMGYFYVVMEIYTLENGIKIYQFKEIIYSEMDKAFKDQLKMESKDMENIIITMEIYTKGSFKMM